MNMNKNAHPFKQLLVLIGSHIGMLFALVVLIVVLAVVINKADVNPVQTTLLGDNPRLFEAISNKANIICLRKSQISKFYSNLFQVLVIVFQSILHCYLYREDTSFQSEQLFYCGHR